jgi:hypothetical protein
MFFINIFILNSSHSSLSNTKRSKIDSKHCVNTSDDDSKDEETPNNSEKEELDY